MLSCTVPRCWRPRSSSAAYTDVLGASVLALIALTTVPARQVLMPAINDATDLGQRQRFVRLHGLSVVITLAHIIAAAATLLWLAN